jgi:hypothetical protein
MASALAMPLCFSWLGDGDPRYRSLLATSGVAVTGWLPSAEASRQLAEGSVLLHTAAYEGASFAVLDAAALGLPVVGRPVPGMTELPWVRHVATPAAALRELQALSHREAWSHQSAAVVASIVELSHEQQRLELLRIYGMGDE